MDEADQGLIIDVAVHVGTLFAVMLYFWRDIWGITKSYTIGIARNDTDTVFFRKLGLYSVLASIPVIIAGFTLHMIVPTGIRSPLVIAIMTLVFGLLLWFADRKLGDRDLTDLGWKAALMVGVAQIFALIPGTSRSGVTMTAARFLGFSRTEAARFALLLGIPAILGAGTLSAIDLIQSGDLHLQQDALIAAVLSFITAYISIIVMMKWLKSSTFTPFVIYRMILGTLLLLYIMV